MNNQEQIFPKARVTDITVQELPDETLIYDLTCDKAHCLNSSAALIWKWADGKRSINEIVEIAQRELDQSVNEDLIMYGLSQLTDAGLMQENGATNSVRQISRRELIKRLGLAIVIALPLVTSIVAPT